MNFSDIDLHLNQISNYEIQQLISTGHCTPPLFNSSINHFLEYDLSDNDLSDNDLSDNDLSDNDLPDNDFSDNDLPDNDLIFNHFLEHDFSDNDIHPLSSLDDDISYNTSYNWNSYTVPNITSFSKPVLTRSSHYDISFNNM